MVWSPLSRDRGPVGKPSGRLLYTDHADCDNEWLRNRGLSAHTPKWIHKDFDLTNSDVMEVALGPGRGPLDQFTGVVPLTVDGRKIFIGTPAYKVHIRYGKMLILSSAVTHGGVCYGERPTEEAPKRYPAF
jgi:hypothetical protein